MLATVIGGIGLFLLGMTLITDGLKIVAGDKIKTILGKLTNKIFYREWNNRNKNRDDKHLCS